MMESVVQVKVKNEARLQGLKKAKLEGLKTALQMAEMHKQHSNDIDYLIATLKTYIEKEEQ